MSKDNPYQGYHAQLLEKLERLERENAALRERLDSVQKSHFTLSKDNAALRELATRMAAEMREIDHEFASLRDYDARKEAQP